MEGRVSASGQGASRGPGVAVGALFFLVAVTAGWWALALWPSADAPPEWLARTRLVCFDAGPDGLPGPSGWLLLIGQPIGMVAVLMVVWGDSVRAGLRALARPVWGKALLASTVVGLGVGLVAAAERVASAGSRAGLVAEEPLPDTYPRLDRPAPAISLLDQHGERVDVASLRGRPALVTFAFGSCETVCPAVVKQTLDARDALRASGGEPAAPRVVIVSLDPWRDTPSRLAHLAAHWQLDADAHVVTGPVDAVEAVLDGWNVARERNPKTGDVVHPPLVYVLDGAGRIAFASTGGTAALIELSQRASMEEPGPAALAGGGTKETGRGS